jgi:hypothetical protein
MRAIRRHRLAAIGIAAIVTGAGAGAAIIVLHSHGPVSLRNDVVVQSSSMTRLSDSPDGALTGPISLTDAFHKAQIVATVTVTNLGTPTWNTPDGKGPTLAEIQQAHQQGWAMGGFYPVTPVSYQVVRVWKGDGASVPATVWMTGGHPPLSAEGLTSSLADAPLPVIGSTMVVFWGPAFDQARGHGTAVLSARTFLQECDLVGESAKCAGTSMSAATLESTLTKFAAAN